MDPQSVRNYLTILNSLLLQPEQTSLDTKHVSEKNMDLESELEIWQSLNFQNSSTGSKYGKLNLTPESHSISSNKPKVNFLFDSTRTQRVNTSCENTQIDDSLKKKAPTKCESISSPISDTVTETNSEVQVHKRKGSQSISADEKRRRNTIASARHRAKKKVREQEVERIAKEQTEYATKLQEKIVKLECEVQWLRGLLLEKNPTLYGFLGSGDVSSVQ